MESRRGNGARESLVAPISHDAGEWDFHRTYGVAAAAKAARVREMISFCQTVEPGVERRPQRSGIGRTIGVAADRAVHRTMIHASAAADALQHFARRTAEHRASAIVEQHDMEILRPVGITGALGP